MHLEVVVVAIKWIFGILGLSMCMAPVVASAQVTMLEPFEFYRADNMRALWDDGEVVSINYTLVLSGRNENNDIVGYREPDSLLDPEDWPAALAAMASLPGNTAMIDAFADAGIVLDGEDLVRPTYTSDFPYSTAQCQLVGPPVPAFGDMTLEDCGTLAYPWIPNPVVGVYYNDTGGPVCTQSVVIYDSTSGTVLEPDGVVPPAMFWGGEETEVCEVTYTASAVDLPLDARYAAQLLPHDVTGDLPPGDLPLTPTILPDQRQRSDSVYFAPGLISILGDVTDYYESTAYVGYPEFELYEGYFSGVLSPPENEGDCPEGFCSDGGTGGGGDGGGIAEFCADNPTHEICQTRDQELIDTATSDQESMFEAVELLAGEGESFLDSISEFELGDGPVLGPSVSVCPLAGGLVVSTDPPITLNTQPYCEISGGPIRLLIGMLATLNCAFILFRGLQRL